MKSALARLAAGDDRPDPEESPGAVVDEAVAATARLDDAAAFVAADGRERLATAVDQLAATGRSVTADRGAAVLADFAALSEAASGASRSTVDDRRTTSAPPTERI